MKECNNILTTIRPLDYKNPNMLELDKYLKLLKYTDCKNINLNFKIFKSIKNDYKKWKSLSTMLGVLLTKYNLKASITHATYFNSMIFENYSKEQLNELRNEIMIALSESKKLGANLMVMHAGISVNDEYSEQSTIDKNTDFFLPITQCAKKLGMEVAIENDVVANPTTVGQVLEPSVEVLNNIVNEINSQIDSKTIGICYDVGHANIAGRDVYGDINKISENLKTLHLHNNLGYKQSDNVWTDDFHSPIVDGELSIEKIVEILKQINFKNDIVIESVYKGTPENIIKSIQEDQMFIKKCFENTPTQNQE